MHDKRRTLKDAIAAIPDGSRVALGGNSVQRAPCAAAHELVRQGKRGLEIIKTAGAYDLDLLAGSGVAASASVGFVGFETLFGMAPSYRRAVEEGRVEAKEHACYTVIAGLRAAIQGVPFMPVAGMFGSDLLAARGFQTIADPYTGAPVVVIPALQPDVAIVHVQEADEFGNARIIGTEFEDVLMAKAARRVIVTTERLVDGSAFEAAPELVAIPSFLVDAVVVLPNGAWPCGCASCYEPDLQFLGAYVAASKTQPTLDSFIRDRILSARLAAA